MSLQRTEYLILFGKSYNIFSYKYIPKEVTVHYIRILRISVGDTTKSVNSLLKYINFLVWCDNNKKHNMNPGFLMAFIL
jgi:hypothetical protein